MKFISSYLQRIVTKLSSGFPQSCHKSNGTVPQNRLWPFPSAFFYKSSFTIILPFNFIPTVNGKVSLNKPSNRKEIFRSWYSLETFNIHFCRMNATQADKRNDLYMYLPYLYFSGNNNIPGYFGLKRICFKQKVLLIRFKQSSFSRLILKDFLCYLIQ